jgi:peptide-methionine (S)-S-oxide reductase
MVPIGARRASSGGVTIEKNMSASAARPASHTEIATLGGGCFWCLDAAFRELRGVSRVESGYTGGHVRQPTYEQVCSGHSGHVEVVQVEFDPAELSYRDLLRIFFTIHDPTTRDRQGNDVGPQYRSAIFVHSPEQRAVAEETIAELAREGVWDAPIVTELAPLETFYPAESYHQDYFRRNPAQGYCRVVVAPKVAKVRRQYADRLRR